MGQAVKGFNAYWRKFSASTPPYVHPDDAKYITSRDFNVDLLPIPVNGNLQAAEVVILMLNPGFHEDDAKWEAKPEFRDGLLRNIQQSHDGVHYPFLYLDPAFAKHPGASYWIGGHNAGPGRRTQQKLRRLAEQLARRDGVSFDLVCMHLAHKLAVLQLLPYHSRKFRRRNLLQPLPSCHQARCLVEGLIREEDKLVVVTRSVKEWGFQGPVSKPNLVVYPFSLGASASLGPDSAGGAAILRRLSSVK